MEDKYIMFSLDDEKSKKLAEVLGNKTCKKIIDFMSDNSGEYSEKDISDKLNIPLNTTEYNLKKLIEVGLVEKTKNHFWSSKGKKIPMYKISNKSIIISPKSTSSKIKSILPVALITGAAAFFIRQTILVGQKVAEISSSESSLAYDTAQVARATADSSPAIGAAAEITQKTSETILTAEPSSAWLWFLGGALIAIFIFAIWNWRKI